MTVARTLPAEVAPRFRGATRALLRSGDASIETVVAERFGLRLRGLAGLTKEDLVPLLFPRCRSLHTLGMRAEIDVVWFDLAPGGKGSVLAVNAGVGHRRLLRAPAAPKRERTAALELPPAAAVRLGVVPGSSLELRVPAPT